MRGGKRAGAGRIKAVGEKVEIVELPVGGGKLDPAENLDAEAAARFHRFLESFHGVVVAESCRGQSLLYLQRGDICQDAANYLKHSCREALAIRQSKSSVGVPVQMVIHNSATVAP